jgi:hypothetical protein
MLVYGLHAQKGLGYPLHPSSWAGGFTGYGGAIQVGRRQESVDKGALCVYRYERSYYMGDFQMFERD